MVLSRDECNEQLDRNSQVIEKLEREMERVEHGLDELERQMEARGLSLDDARPRKPR